MSGAVLRRLLGAAVIAGGVVVLTEFLAHDEPPALPEDPLAQQLECDSRNTEALIGELRGLTGQPLDTSPETCP